MRRLLFAVLAFGLGVVISMPARAAQGTGVAPVRVGGSQATTAQPTRTPTTFSYTLGTRSMRWLKMEPGRWVEQGPPEDPGQPMTWFETGRDTIDGTSG